jgi:hypothetical protein
MSAHLVADDLQGRFCTGGAKVPMNQKAWRFGDDDPLIGFGEHMQWWAARHASH